MTSGYWEPGEPGAHAFDEFLARFFGGPPASLRPQRIDLGRLMSQEARELVAVAAQHAVDRGEPDLDREHLLWAATQHEPLRQLLTRAGAGST